MQEIVGLLKARLRMDNPQKQFLSVKLVEQVRKEPMHTLTWRWVIAGVPCTFSWHGLGS